MRVGRYARAATGDVVAEQAPALTRGCEAQQRAIHALRAPLMGLRVQANTNRKAIRLTLEKRHATNDRPESARISIRVIAALVLGLCLAPAWGISTDKLLQVYVGAGDAPKVRESLENGADPNWVSRNGNSLLDLAVQGGWLEVTELLLKAGADPNQNSTARSTPLYEAAIRHPGSGLAKLLLRYGADPNGVYRRHGLTPLFPAIENGDVALVRLLVKQGADVNHQDKDGNTPLIRAASTGNAEIVKLLLDQGGVPTSPYRTRWVIQRPSLRY